MTDSDATFDTPTSNTSGEGLVADAFESRLEAHWPTLEDILSRVYRDRPDLSKHFGALRALCRRSWAARPEELKARDESYGDQAGWHLSHDTIGATLYVDLFAGDFNGVRERIPYLKSLGVNYLHLMPLFKSPEGNSDGGYAVSSYRECNPKLGTLEDLGELIAELRAEGIVAAVDFVFNHTSDEHTWAQAAIEGDARFLRFYYTYDSREIPERYERTLREIFPEVRRGSFSWSQPLGRWVWTSFNSFQWDLNYANPDVFVAMAGEMLYLANLGIDVLRLDAVAFLWKQLGTDCENRPEAHALIRAFNQVCRIAAPSVLFKSEAIVHPNNVEKYIDVEECQLSYNPTLMALLWEAAATRETRLLARSMSYRQAIKPGTNWVNYLRCHDDIGWSFDNSDARFVGIDPHGHRRFLNEFYSGRFPGSFARGVPFQYNPTTNDMRICGTTASLIGIEDAIKRDDAVCLDMALRRARMLYGVLMSAGGIPLIYMGEERGDLNDYAYLDDPDKAGDARWVHRPSVDWSRSVDEEPFYVMLRELIEARREQRALSGTDIEVLSTPSPHLLMFRRDADGDALTVIANFSEQVIPVSGGLVPAGASVSIGRDVLSGCLLDQQTQLAPYALHWCRLD